MSVEIYHVDEEICRICIAVSSERFFIALWEPAFKALGITRLGNGVWLYQEDLPGILRDFERVGHWSEDHLSGIDGNYVVTHVESILNDLPENWAKNRDIKRLWMG